MSTASSKNGISNAIDALLKEVGVFVPPSTMRKVIRAYLEAAQDEKLEKNKSLEGLHSEID
jgi:hypothetical protein